MQLKTVKISGFKSIPFCATYTVQNRGFDIQWNNDCFMIPLPDSSAENGSSLTALIGANSAGKSNILLALESFFDNKTKLPLDCFNEKQDDSPIIIEIEFVGSNKEIDQAATTYQCPEFRNHYCRLDGSNYCLTAGLVWPRPDQGGRFYYIRKSNQTCIKISRTQEKNLLNEALFPTFRLIKADSRLHDEANPSKVNLLQELIDDVLKIADPQGINRRNIVVKIRKKLDQLKDLVKRIPNDPQWRFLEELENQITDSLENITPSKTHVSIDISQSVPELTDLFHNSKIKIIDGIELDFDKQGLGLQRSFVLALLRTWSNRIGGKTDGHNYFFAIEEPEIYLHPHATRVMLNTLQSIAQKHQVIFTTHSSEFVNRVPLENVYLVYRENTKSRIKIPDFSNLPHKSDLYKVKRHLQESRSDVLFARSALLVEGQSEWYALPYFSQTLGIDLDGQGVSIVCTHSKDNFKTYHLILRQFGIPHVILGDGDGNKIGRINQYTAPPFQMPADSVFVLEYDFERELSTKLSDNEICQLINLARREIGQQELPDANILKIPPGETREEYFTKKFKKLGKPLIGRIAGNILGRERIEQLDCVKQALDKAIELTC